MDVHRSRFIPYPTSAISALAFSRSNDNGYTGPPPALKLAVGRENGSIEIWNPQRGLWVQETVFLGNNNTSIDGLAWTQDPDEQDSDGHTVPGQQRLFSIASSPSITEWNLGTGQAKRQSTGNFSEVWCFAAQPRWKPQKDSREAARAQDIVAGCGDGTLVLLSTAEDDLQFKRFLARVSGKKARCMCLTYQTRDRVVGGFADGMVRIYDTRNGSQLRTMSLGVGVPGAPKTALVWQVRCLPNGDIVSGDSNGEVKFWDGKTYSLLQRIDGHDSDCLDLVTSNDGRTIMSGSIDGKVAIYRQSTGDHGRKTWAKNSHRRTHSGEVKAMAAFDSKGMSVVVTGGSDVAPIVTPLREYGKEHLRSLPTLPQDPPVTSAPRARLIVSWWEKSIYIWRISRHSDIESAPEPLKPRKLVARVTLDTKDRIASVAISPDGKLLTAATSTEVKVFQLRRRVEYVTLAIRKLVVPEELATLGARLLAFSPDGRWLACISHESEVHIGRIAHDPERPKHYLILPKVVDLDRRHRKESSSTGFREYERTITRLAFAYDSSVLVASDLAGYMDSWVLEGHEDLTAPAVDSAKHDSQDGSSNAGSDSDSSSDDDDDRIAIFYGQHWADNPAGHLLPKLDSPPLVLTFRPLRTSKHIGQALVNGNPGVHSTRHNPHAHSHEMPHGQHRLWIMTAKHQMYEFEALAGRLSDWGRRNPTSVLPEDFTKIRDRVMGAVWDVSEQRERVWLYGASFVCMLDVTGDLAETEASQALVKKRRKPKGGTDDEESRKRRRIGSGAGGVVNGSSKEGVVDVIRRYDEDGALSKVDSEHPKRSALDADEDEGEDDDDAVGLQLTHLKSSGDEVENPNHAEAISKRDRKVWLSFKYRPILSVVPIEDDLDTTNDKPLEVVIVERPLREE